MDIAIYSAGLPHAEGTLALKSMGGSETAALMCAKYLAKRGHCVTMYTRQPAKGEPDYVEEGHIGRDGVRYRSIENYAHCITGEPVDLLIVSRDPTALALPHQARKAVLWMHDLATMQLLPALGSIAWNLDEIWTVSEFHRRQVHELTGHPLSHIVALRNGIIQFDDEAESEFPVERDPKLLYFGSRPERGLMWLVAPGGIMERLPEYRLQFSIYGDPRMLPQHVQELYQQLFAAAKRLPNVEFLGNLTQLQVRNKLRECAALVYPSDFEETSCILAREAISVLCPIIACEVGALPETVGQCGALCAPPRKFGDDQNGFVRHFTSFLQGTLESETALQLMRENCLKRMDLGWEQVAVMMEHRANTEPPRPLLARAKALVEVGDVIPALALLADEIKAGPTTEAARVYENWLRERYETVMGPEADLAYEERYADETPTYGDLRQTARYKAVSEYIAGLNLPTGSTVIDYGCCEGNVVLNLARDFPDLKFVGYDHAPTTYAKATDFATNSGITNIRFTCLQHDWIKDGAAAVILGEILEHQVEPWSLIDKIERQCSPGTHIVITTPIGPWEVGRIYQNRKDFGFPEHLWHLDKPAIEGMLSRKRGLRMTFVPFQICPRTMLLLGNFFTAYQVDRRRKTLPLDALEKAKRVPRIHIPAVAAIAMNDENDILRMLKSCEAAGIRDFALAVGPSTDATHAQVDYFEAKYPWCRVKRLRVPPVEAGKVGFDDVRNMSLAAVADDYDMVLWIDCDEELIGRVGPYLRNNSYDAYAINQHHVTVDPRGVAPQVDKPARFIRPSRGFRFYGKIHEHAELGPNGGPGQVLILPDADIMHTGYKNEEVRKKRFWRNLPFLNWDRQTNPDRKLGKYLWLRDLVHQMRYAHQNGEMALAAQFAQQAVQFYNEQWRDMVHFGNGVIQGFQYVSEARRYLQQGIPVATMIKLSDGRGLVLEGQITEPAELTQLVDHLLKDECERAKSRYR